MNSSRSLYRTNSTGGLNRIGSASSASSRAGSAGPENRILREQITRLQKELMYSKADTQKVTDQLNCLILLIKRAWSGERTANVHIANIIGMAPPDMDINSGVNEVVITTKPKTRGINNWAVLTIGLLNREYRRLERELEVKQRIYLQRRQDFLEEQLIENRDQILHLERNARQAPYNDQNHYTSAPQERHCTSPVEGLQPELQVVYGKQNINVAGKTLANKPPNSGLQRKWSAKGRRPKEVKQETNLTLADVLIEPSSGTKMNKNTSVTMDGLYRLPSTASKTDSSEPEVQVDNDEDRMFLTYDDPRRYAQRGLFEVESVLGTSALPQRRRPLDEQLKQTDTIRARPKSATVKSERPLKYETTRPISAHVSSKTRDSFHLDHSSKISNNKRQVKSAKTRQFIHMDTVSYSNNQTPTEKIHNNLKSSNGGESTTRSDCGDVEMEKIKKSVKFQQSKKEEIQKLLTEDPQLAHLLQIDVTRPECIAEFDEDLKDMEHREKDFAKRAVELQRKLGIDQGGLLYPNL